MKEMDIRIQVYIEYMKWMHHGTIEKLGAMKSLSLSMSFEMRFSLFKYISYQIENNLHLFAPISILFFRNAFFILELGFPDWKLLSNTTYDIKISRRGGKYSQFTGKNKFLCRWKILQMESKQNCTEQIFFRAIIFIGPIIYSNIQLQSRYILNQLK